MVTDLPRTTIDGNEAAADVAYRLNELCAIYPITPSSTMAELADEWSSHQRPNLWGTVPTVIEMQSEGGAAGALHGALQAGALATTFTASQGLLLMIPNMYKIAGELTSSVIHVAARSLAAQGLSIFGDHPDVMAVRQTGFALLSSGSVQEAHDFALVAQAATLRARVPFVHFFDGFRTSHELNTIELLPDDVLRAVVPEPLVHEHRMRSLSPERPFVRGTAQNPDVYFQARETVNPFYTAVPGIVQAAMDEVAAHTGRSYRLVEYAGHPEAERVMVIMGSGGQTVEETVRHLVAAGERVGVLRLRLYRPFPADELLAALPSSVRSVAVLDRTKEPGSGGEPLFLDVVSALSEAVGSGQRAAMPRVVGGRYGLSSKEFTPGMVAGVYAALAAPSMPARFTVGIHDDVTGLSIDYDPDLDIEDPETLRAVFFGLGSDGTVGANKNTIKILGADESVFAQAYFVYDSKKSGATTVSHLRFGPHPMRSPYLVRQAGFVGCHHLGLLDQLDVLGVAAPGGTLLLNAPLPPEEVWDALSAPGAGADRGQAAAAVRDRRGPGGARRRAAGPHQHRASDLLLRDLRRAAPRGGDHPGEGGDREDLRQAWSRRGGAQRRRRRRRAGGAARDRGGGRHLGAAAAAARARLGAGLRARGHRDHDGRSRRRPAGERAAGRRHLAERHHGVREAPDLRRGRRVGPRGVHPVRQLRLRLPALRDARDILRGRLAGAGARRLRVGAAQRRRAAQQSLHAAGLHRGLHGLRAVRRGLPDHGAWPTWRVGPVRGVVGRRPQGDQPDRRPGGARRGAGPGGLLRVAAGAGAIAGRLRDGARDAVPAAALRVLRRLRGVRRDAVPQAAHAALR